MVTFVVDRSAPFSRFVGQLVLATWPNLLQHCPMGWTKKRVCPERLRDSGVNKVQEFYFIIPV